MILLAFCENCTWEILPMLIGAWFLGWLFWHLFQKPKYQNKINSLTSNIGALQTAAHTASLVEQEPNADMQRLNDELKSAQSLNQDFNAQLRSLRIELENKQHVSSESQTELNRLKESLNLSNQENIKFKSELENRQRIISESQTKLFELEESLSTSKQDALQFKNNIEQLNVELKTIKSRNVDLQQLLTKCEAEKEELQNKKEPAKDNNYDYEQLVSNQYLETPVTESKDEVIDVFEENKSPVIKKEKSNSQPSYAQWLDNTNLKIVEGVGPKIESLMKDAGIRNWEDLSNTEPSTIQNILNEAGPRYRVHDPKSWPLQARLAFKEDWTVLINLQKDMGGSKGGSKDKNNRSKVEKLIMKAKGIKAFAPDDLKIIEGVGPKIEGLLKADGISNWEELAVTKPEKIKAILTKAGDRYRLADPTTWPKQAKLAAKGDWEELKNYQDRLKGGIE